MKRESERASSASLISVLHINTTSFAEVLQGKHTLKSQIIDKIITLALQGQCKCWDVAFS